MGNAWSKHVGEWYDANKGANGINSLSDAMRSSKCKADFRAKKGGPTMKTEKKGKKTRKVKGGSSLSPATFDSAPVQTSKVDTPVVKGGKKGSSLKNVLKEVEKMILKGGLKKSKKLKGGAVDITELNKLKTALAKNNDCTTEANAVGADAKADATSSPGEADLAKAIETYTTAAATAGANFTVLNPLLLVAIGAYEKAGGKGSGGGGPVGTSAPASVVSGGASVDVMVHVKSTDGKTFTADIVPPSKP
jgi:hypothetical protein